MFSIGTGEHGECDSRCVIGAPRPDLAFNVTGKLLPEKQVLGRQFRSGPKDQPQQTQQVSEKGECPSEHDGDGTVCNQVAIGLRGGGRAMGFFFAGYNYAKFYCSYPDAILATDR